MYKSTEIRWFIESSDRAILDWFARQGQTIDNTVPRTDFYLPLKEKDITVKLREGNIEIKHLVGETLCGSLTPSAEGYFEHWIKWSFNADKEDKLSQQIMESNTYDWVEIIKTRLGMKMTKDDKDKLLILPIKAFVNFGCQVEFTNLIIDGKIYNTFALEWFGKETLELGQEFMNEILGPTKLLKLDSMGYGEFLKTILK